jgi:imidazolonepropionase-like amidohydrolase
MRIAILCGGLLLAAAAPAQERAAVSRPVAFVGATLLPIVGPAVPDGTLVVRDGKIVAVGASADVTVPADAERIDVKGKVVMPGLVDTHSHVGGGWGADQSAPIQPAVRMLDAIDCRDAGFQRAQAGGITTINVMSGSGHLMSGQTLYVKNKDARTIEEMSYKFADGSPMGGMKMANGTNSHDPPPFPGTRGKSAALVRETFVAALEYRKKIAAAAGDASKLPPRDLGHEAILELIDGKKIVHHHTHRHDDILTVLRLKAEFGFRVVLHHVSEAWKVADEIAAADAPCSLIVIDSPGGKLEAMDFDAKSAAELEKRGAAKLVAFHTDDWITDSRLFLRSPALAVRAGVSRETALAGVTLHAARMLDLGDRIGALEPSARTPMSSCCRAIRCRCTRASSRRGSTARRCSTSRTPPTAFTPRAASARAKSAAAASAAWDRR